MLTDKRKEEVVSLCQRLIKAKGYSGGEEPAAKELEKAFKTFHFDDIYVDRYGNIIGHVKGARPGKKVLFDGHMDTVPVTEESAWAYPPFGAEIHHGRIYGRGASDMKGAVAAMVCAAGYFAEDTKREFAGDIYVAGVVHEECFEGVASREVSKRTDPDYVVIGEASQLNVKIGQRGRAEIKVEVTGKPAHSANPEKGINAVYKLCDIIQKIRELEPEHNAVLGDGILELTDILSSPYPGASVVPEFCSATYDRRLLCGETKESVLEPIERLLREMADKDADLKARAYYSKGKEQCYTGESIEGERFFPAWLFDREEDFIQDIVKGLRADGLAPEITQYNFCTNGSHYAGERGIKTIGLGPSYEHLAHTVDEYIEIEQLTGAVQSYYSVMKTLLKP